MKYPMSKHGAGLVVGLFLGVWHLAWALLVAGGWAQPFMDWIFRLHFIQPPYHITPFILRDAVLLILITFGLGYVLGWIFAGLWNWMHPTDGRNTRGSSTQVAD